MQAVKVENNAFEDLAEALVRSRIRRCEPEIEKDQPIRFSFLFFRKVLAFPEKRYILYALKRM